MGVGAGLYMYVVVVQKFTFAISSPDEFLLACEQQITMLKTGSKLIKKWRRYKSLKIAQSISLKV